MNKEETQKLIDGYEEALSDDSKLRDYYRRQWIETKAKEQFFRLPKKWRERIAAGRAKIEVLDRPPELTDEQLKTLKEFFRGRYAELKRIAEAEEVRND